MRNRIVGDPSCAAAILLAAVTGVSASAAVGAVYTATNSPAGNEILMFDRAPDGTLTFVDAFATGGAGSGNGLGNQGGITMTADGKFLIAVNAGSHDISVLEVRQNGLTLRDRAASGGLRPVSVTVNARLVYVLNAGGSAGGSDSVVGFRLSRDGHLTTIASSARSLSAPSTGPAQVDLSPSGANLIVTEKATHRIDIFPVEDTGLLGAAMSFPSSGVTPFGFAFGKHDQFFVSEAFAGAVDGSAVSSYHVSGAAAITLVSASVPTTETAACWVAVTVDGRFAYATNAGSGTISGFNIRSDGTITLRDPSGVTGTTGPGVSDVTVTGNGRYLYALRSGAGAITAFRIEEHGELTAIGATPLPVGANGIFAR